ncbi:hypothetical protein [Kiloniella antarctica]|uniref:Alkaline phytoceramidase n=1 Tax=Kiloniella antarctica TaxID=1550907 RepID=A0ABW5BER4_9PROT
MLEKRSLMLVVSLVVLSAALLLASPIPQDPAYHIFADTRSCLGVANFGDVISNGGFLLVGLIGLVKLKALWQGGRFDNFWQMSPFLLFFIAVAFVAPGSAYYHEVPDNDRLFWDRLPMTIAFMSLFAGILADRVHVLFSGKALWVMVLFGVVSLLYWRQTEIQGVGDLRPYVLVQFYPLVVLPLICWLYPRFNLTPVRYLIWMYVWYTTAKGLEFFDAEVYQFFETALSGHSLKHLVAALAVYMVVKMLSDKTVLVLKL